MGVIKPSREYKSFYGFDKDYNSFVFGLIVLFCIVFIIVFLLLDESDVFVKEKVVVKEVVKFIDVDNISFSGEAVGIYRSNEYFCVSVKNRDIEQIADITFHELAHHYRRLDESHFCGGVC